MLSHAPVVCRPPGIAARRRTRLPDAPANTAAWLVLLLGLAVGGSSACSRRPVAAGPPVPVPRDEANRLLADLEHHQDSIARYQAVLRVRGEGPEGRFSATELVIFERPDRIRIELLATFGSSRWIAVTDGGEITVLFPRSREYLRESAVGDVVSALFGVRLQARDVMAILAGSGLPLGDAGLARAERVGERLRIVLRGGPGEAPEPRLEVAGGQVREAVSPRYRVRYPTDWKRRGRTAPDEIEIASERIEASLTVEDLDINVPLDPQAFTIVLPEGAARLGVAEIGGEAVFVRPSQ